MCDSRVLLYTAANGFAKISTFSFSCRMRLALLLMFRYGFWRWGIWIPSITGEAIYPDFICGTKRILAGWDNWFGYDFLADNEETDIFLRRFFEKHCR